MFKKYYQDELRYLKEMGGEFCRSNSDIASFLDGTDPDAARLLEGFAFLSASIRQKLDDEIPEFTQGLLQLKWPHHLRPVPAASILEFEPFMAQLRAPKTIERGVEVDSVPVEGREDVLSGTTSCRFQTTTDVVLNPITIEDVKLETVTIGHSQISIEFRVHNEVPPAMLSLDKLRLFLHDGANVGVDFALYLHLCQHVDDAYVTAIGDDGQPGERWPIRIEPAGFADDEALTPGASSASPGHRLLHEYFAFPKKFLFVDLIGLDGLAKLESLEQFRVEVVFSRELAGSLRPSTEHLRLNCTPIVNVFRHHASPIKTDREQSEFLVRPAGKNPLHYEVYSFEKVIASAPGDIEGQEVPSFYSFAEVSADVRYRYYPRFRSSVLDSRGECYLVLIDSKGQSADASDDTVSIELNCTNRRLPEGLSIGDIHISTESSPEFVKFRNLTIPTDSVSAKLDGGLLWQLISQQALNYTSMADLSALRSLLRLSDSRGLRGHEAGRDNERKIQGVQRIEAHPTPMLLKRPGVGSGAQWAEVQGWNITIDLLETQFAADGDAYLFASVMKEFLRLHASLNTVVRVEVCAKAHGERYSWEPQSGQQSPF